METKKDDLLTALSGGHPKNVVWAEMDISPELKKHFLKEVPPGLTFEEHFGIANYICGALCPPGIVEWGISPSGRKWVKRGLLRTRSDLYRIKESFPDPHNSSLYKQIREELKRGPKTLAKCVITDLGAGASLVSMGVDGFSYALIDDRSFVEEVFLRHAEWSAVVHKNLCSMGVDFIWSGGDIAFRSGPFFSPEVFRTVILPALQISADAISVPWVYHSDGNLMPILEDLLSLGMDALHPFEPEVMDIITVKKTHKNLCVIGNVSIDLLAQGTPDKVEEVTKNLIYNLHPMGGYIISSSNAITDYVAPENFYVMSRCIKKFQ